MHCYTAYPTPGIASLVSNFSFHIYRVHIVCVSVHVGCSPIFKYNALASQMDAEGTRYKVKKRAPTRSQAPRLPCLLPSSSSLLCRTFQCLFVPWYSQWHISAEFSKFWNVGEGIAAILSVLLVGSYVDNIDNAISYVSTIQDIGDMCLFQQGVAACPVHLSAWPMALLPPTETFAIENHCRLH